MSYRLQLRQFFTLLFVLLCTCDVFGFHITHQDEYRSPIRNRRQTTATGCARGQFKCASGQCIPQDEMCDGQTNCNDKSDETRMCLKEIKNCPDFAFRCAYGACVDGDAECNGVRDCVDNSDEMTARCKNVTKTPNRCGREKFQCQSGECIDKYLVCEGTKDCRDGSDETETECSEIRCPDYAYKCYYGACVSGDARCNNITECADGSDEDPEICGKPAPGTTTLPPVVTEAPPPDGSCILPSQPAFGNYYHPNIPNLTPGQKIAPFSVITYTCSSGYELFPQTGGIAVCLQGIWNSNYECRKTCPPRVSQSVDFTCTLNNVEQNCMKPLLEGTIVRMQCKRYYENDDRLSRSPTTQCKDGSWDYEIIKCYPVCGKIIQKGQQFIVGGQSAVKGDFPWHVAIYDQTLGNSHICGGSIINNKLVLSAAHCFTDDAKGQKKNASNYLVSSGKYYRLLDDARDKDFSQRSHVKDIVVNEDYRGLQLNLQADIAIVVLQTPFEMTHVVQPVCFDWDSKFEDTQLSPGNKGIVVGWGFTKEGQNPSDELKQLSVPYIDKGKCLEIVPEDFQEFVTPDKFCAGYTNGSSVCQGDSGGGLVFYRDDVKRYYIRGIVSAGPIKSGSCDSHQYGVYTKVSKYIDFILQTETKHRQIV